jgi:hypothetical protein
MANDEPATKSDVTRVEQQVTLLRSEMKQDVALLRSEMQQVYDNLVEQLADRETKLLKAFYTFAESN